MHDAAQIGGGTGVEAALAPDKADGVGSTHRDPEHRTGIAAKARGYIHRDYRQFAAVDRFDDLGLKSSCRATESGAEYGIDNQLALARRLLVPWRDAHTRRYRRVEGQPCITANAPGITDQGNARGNPSIGREPCHHETITAVIAGTANDVQRRIRIVLARQIEHRAPCPLHQHTPRYALLDDGGAIECPHLLRGIQRSACFRHGLRLLCEQVFIVSEGSAMLGTRYCGETACLSPTKNPQQRSCTTIR